MAIKYGVSIFFSGLMKIHYKYIRNKNHPKAYPSGHILLHRDIAEKAIGKLLPDSAVVHHHTLDQLVICQNVGYHKLLHRKTKALELTGHADWLKCEYCGKYDSPKNLLIRLNRNGSQQQVHRICKNQYKKQRRHEKIAKSPTIPVEYAKVGDKIYFAEEVKAYTVQAKGERYIVCTKPLNLRHTVLYTIVDTEEKIRGTENLVFGLGAETQEQCEQMLDRLEGRDTEIGFAAEVSHKNRIHLNIDKVITK